MLINMLENSPLDFLYKISQLKLILTEIKNLAEEQNNLIMSLFSSAEPYTWKKIEVLIGCNKEKLNTKQSELLVLTREVYTIFEDTKQKGYKEAEIKDTESDAWN